MNTVSTHWKQTRISLLGILLFSLFGLLIYKILVPEETEKITNTQGIIVPENVSLSQWKLVETQPLKPIKPDPSKIHRTLGKKYEYRDGQEKLKAEIRYSKYYGSFNQLLIIDLRIPAATISPDIYYQKGVGHYAFFEYDNATYLGSCINAQGEATVTLSQYNQNRYRHGWGLGRTFLWLIGQKDLVEYRCLWTIMSIPQVGELDLTVNINDDNKTLNETEKKLEQAWLEWYSWWKKDFPDY